MTDNPIRGVSRFGAMIDDAADYLPPPLMPCSYCGRIMLVGVCCIRARLRALRQAVSREGLTPGERRETRRALKLWTRRLVRVEAANRPRRS